MDTGREGDLQRMRDAFNDRSLPKHSRRAAWQAFNKILRQMKDRRLTYMRARLARAHMASDTEAVDRLTTLIEAYSERQGYN